MADKPTNPQKSNSPDWFVRGALGRIGDTFDRFLGRNWTPSSTLATSELIERIKRLLDAEARDVPGKGRVVPHRLELKVEWDKFATDSEDAIGRLEAELLTATVDHINDSLYYTFAPVEIEVKPDYFIEGVKLAAGFGRFVDAAPGVEMNVTLPAAKVSEVLKGIDEAKLPAGRTLRATFTLNGIEKIKELSMRSGESISIGRIGSNEIVIDDTNVSKTHASLLLTPQGTLSLADTGSTNGTFINGQRIAYAKAMTINDSDILKFGTIEVKFEVPEPELTKNEIEDADPAKTVEIGDLTFTSRTSDDVKTEIAESKEPEVPKE